MADVNSPAAPAVNAPQQQSQHRPPGIVSMQVTIKGRIESSRTYEGKRYTQIMTPAADQYSRPQVVEVRSKSKLGERTDEISIVATLGGYQRKPYQVKDKDSGEISMIVPTEHTLDAVE